MPFAFHYAARSDVGMVRSNNEDSGYAGSRLLAMADGMGGHAGGDVASSTVIGALVELLDEGVIVRAGISNADVDQIDLADEILGGRLVSVQNQFSPRFRSSLAELEHCARRGIAFLPWSPLGGIAGSAELADRQQLFARVAAELYDLHADREGDRIVLRR